MKLRFYIVIILLSLFYNNLTAQEYKRIVSLAPFITNNLYLLGVQDQIVGRTQYCMIADKDQIPIVADAINVNVEKIANLKPDIVIASGLTHPRIIAAIEKMGIPTLHWNQPKNFEELCSQFEKLGKLCGKNEVATRYLQESRERLARIPKIAKGKKIFMEVGYNPLFTALSDSFMNDYMVLLGGKNIFEDLTNGVISRETVLLRNPDIIITIIQGDQEVKNWLQYNTLRAVQTGQVFSIDPDLAGTPTPVTFINVLEIITQKLQ